MNYPNTCPHKCPHCGYEIERCPPDPPLDNKRPKSKPLKNPGFYGASDNDAIRAISIMAFALSITALLVACAR